MKTKLIIGALLILFFASCQSGYRKENGQWVWVSYDESVGKRITPIDAHDAKSFKVLKSKKYAKDKNAVFYHGRLIENADPKSFQVIHDSGYSKDKNRVFLDENIIVLADPATFEFLEFPYSKDSDHVYCGNIPLKISPQEVNEFNVTNTDELMSASKSTILFSHFIEMNQDYKWLDSTKIRWVVVGQWGTGTTKNKKFKGFREVN
ncbi:MAG: DKNYY domain-containing protein [Saprospiraceae bacterium]|nr:DKNYY domain-containing protein [Saprospiraceae bacterium]